MSQPEIYGRSYARVRVGLCQIRTVPWSIEENLTSTLAALNEAAERGAQLAITPECVLHGYAAEPEKQAHLARLRVCAEPVDGPSMRRISEVARRRRMAVVVGFAERGSGDQIHNSAAVFDATGRLVDCYRKIHCRDFERIEGGGGFTPGSRFVVCPIRTAEMEFRLGVMICFDREISETVRCLRSLGAELIACPLACDTSSLNVLERYADNELITRCRAAENEVFIAVVNHAARFNGGSFAVGPRGETLVQLGIEQDVQIVELPLGGVRAAYHGKPLGWMGWGYRRPAVYERVPGFAGAEPALPNDVRNWSVKRSHE
ncbi:MAG: carbon-nitrogen hydrolase family protein [Caldimonas sp.]